MPEATVSIIIVNYNAGAWLIRSVQSALDFSNAIITVVDNNSSDDSIAQAQSEFADQPRVQWQLNDRNRGFAYANNQVLKHVETDYALLMNPDCEINKDTLTTIIEQCEKDSQIGLASCLIYNQDGSVQATCRRRFPTPWSAFVRMLGLHKVFANNPRFANFDYADDSLLKASVAKEQEAQSVEAISGAFMLARCSSLETVGLLDENYFMHCEDLDWCKRFHLADLKVAFVPQASVVHAKGVSSESRPIRVLWTLHRGMNRFFNKFYKSDYNIVLRSVVSLGIYSSFVLRASKTVISGLLNSFRSSKQ